MISPPLPNPTITSALVSFILVIMSRAGKHNDNRWPPLTNPSPVHRHRCGDKGIGPRL